MVLGPETPEKEDQTTHTSAQTPQGGSSKSKEGKQLASKCPAAAAP